MAISIVRGDPIMHAMKNKHCLLNKNKERFGKLTKIGTMYDSTLDLKLRVYLKSLIGKQSTYQNSFIHNRLKSPTWWSLTSMCLLSWCPNLYAPLGLILRRSDETDPMLDVHGKKNLIRANQRDELGLASS